MRGSLVLKSGSVWEQTVNLLVELVESVHSVEFIYPIFNSSIDWLITVVVWKIVQFSVCQD